MKKLLLSAALAASCIANNALADCDDSFTVKVTSSDLQKTDLKSSVGLGATAHVFADGPLDKPVIVVEGIDIEGVIGCQAIHDSLNSGYGLVNQLNAQGRDIVIVDFEDTMAGIEPNALALMKVIEEVNNRKVGFHSNAVVGLSLGGLVSRYTLSHMEHYGIEHETSLFISYDAPQRFAYLPAELVTIMPFFVKQPGLDMVDEIFGSRTVKQILAARPWYMLDDEFDSDGNGIDEVWIDDVDHNEKLMDKLLKIGNYPQNLRKVAFSNGSAREAAGRQGIDPGTLLMTIDPSDELTGKTISLHSSQFFLYEASLDCMESEYEKYRKYFSTGYFQNEGAVSPECVMSPYYSPHVTGYQPDLADISFEDAPGSRSEIVNRIVDGLPSDADTTITVHTSDFAFIPTVSSLDINGPFIIPPELTEDIERREANGDNHLTPFDQLYYPSDGANEHHLEITFEKSYQLMDEINTYHGPLEDSAKQAAAMVAILHMMM